MCQNIDLKFTLEELEQNNNYSKLLEPLKMLWIVLCVLNEYYWNMPMFWATKQLFAVGRFVSIFRSILIFMTED